MSKAIDDLTNEHDAILSSLLILEAMLTTMEKAPSLDRKDIQDFIGFLKEFADKCHHGKEEGLLFPALVAAGVPEQGGPIGVLLAEHAQGRQLIREMENSVSKEVDFVKFARSARGYVSLLRDHIQKENHVLFPRAERVLTEAQLKGLYEEFEEHEENVIGHGRHEQLHALLKSLQDKYARNT